MAQFTKRVLRRTLKIDGIEIDVDVSMDVYGIQFQIKDTDISVSATWQGLVRACSVPEFDTPQFQNGYEYLQYHSEQIVKRNARRIMKKAIEDDERENLVNSAKERKRQGKKREGSFRPSII